MNSEDQTLCPQCRLQFSEDNPPRLLTMCGHTFCDSCLKEMMVKKKINNKFKLTCPIDKMSIDLSLPSTASFPKNLSLLSLVRKLKECNQANFRFSDQFEPEWSFVVGESALSSIKNQIPKQSYEDQNNKKDSNPQKSLINSMCNFSSNICLLHQKPLDLVCVRDCKKICASCAIFGEHRGHGVKDVGDVEDLTRNLCSKLHKFQSQCSQQSNQLESRGEEYQLERFLANKKIQLQEQISQKFRFLISQAMSIEKVTLSKLDQRFQEIQSQIKVNMGQKISLKERCLEIEQSLSEKLNLLSSENEEQSLKFVLFCDGFLENSQKSLHSLIKTRASLFQQSQKMIETLALSSDQSQIIKALKDYCKIQNSNNSFLEVNTSAKGNITQEFPQNLHEESLLDDIETVHYPSNNSFKLSFNSPSKTKKNMSCLLTQPIPIFENKNPSRVSRVKSITNRSSCMVSPSHALSSVKSARGLGLNSSKINVFKVKDVPLKVEGKVDAVLKGATDTLDLTNGELGNQKIVSILQAIKQNPVTTVKLVRNCLTDECFENIIPFLNNVSMLNLSRNDLTEQSVYAMIKARRDGYLQCLKSLMIGQNRIIERKNRELFEEMKRQGINVCV